MEKKIGNLKEGENVEKIVRRHWIVYVQIMIYFMIGVSVTSALLNFFGFQFWNSLALLMFWMMYSLFLYVEWVNHELDLFIITNTRIIGIEQISFLNRTVSECHLAQVQEVNAKTKGLLANILNYGTLLIQTAGNASNFEVEYAPDLRNTSSEIMNIVDKYRGDGSLKERVLDKKN